MDLRTSNTDAAAMAQLNKESVLPSCTKLARESGERNCLPPLKWRLGKWEDSKLQAQT
uniref:Uncharacterized protein n=1 Tax=Leersia perrieri TaxID=77586 RepID=A0A0D9UWH5_9ORYZ